MENSLSRPRLDPSEPLRAAEGEEEIWHKRLLLALLVATALKVAWALSSAGSVDAFLFFSFARFIHKVGLCGLYQFHPLYNHTPLTGSFLWLLYQLSGAEFHLFSLLLRLVGILADAAVVLGLWRWRRELGNPPRWVLVLLAASPVSVMVSGFHGNIDPVMVAVLFFASAAAVLNRPRLCGVLFALACNVKIVPMVLGPVFFFYWMARAKAWRFMAPVILGLAAGSVLPLVVCPQAYLQNVFGYSSVWGVWGVPYFLRLSGWATAQKVALLGLSAGQLHIMQGLKMIAVGGIVSLAWRRRAVDALPATLGMAWIVFFVFAPGLGVQYLSWFAPFLVLLCPRAYALLTAASSFFLFAFYHCAAKGQFPWIIAQPRSEDVPFWSAIGVPVWFLFVALLLKGVSFFGDPPERE